MKETKNGAPYETPRMEVVLIEHGDVISTSLISEGDYDQNGWT